MSRIKARFNYAVARKQRRSQFKRNLDGYFGVARAQEILEEIFFKNGRGPEIIMDPRKTRRARNYIRV